MVQKKGSPEASLGGIFLKVQLANFTTNTALTRDNIATIFGFHACAKSN
jgi:hypothetical protein